MGHGVGRGTLGGMDLDELIARFDVTDPAFIADPYPTLDALREAAPIFWNPSTEQWMLTRFADVASTLRDRRVGRGYTHRYSHEEFGQPAPDPRWDAFNEHERWSLLSLEPPDHTRLRRLISKVFTPSSIAKLRERVTDFAGRRIDRCAEIAADTGSFDLLSDYAQPYSVAVICSMLGVPDADADRLLAWSHAIVKMYELSSDDATKGAADQAAAEYIEYTRELIADKRRHPDDLLVSQLVQVTDEGDSLTEDEIIGTTMVLVEAGHEATVNTLGNGFRALMHHRDEWQRLVSGDVGPCRLRRGTAPLRRSVADVRTLGARGGGGDRRAADRGRPRGGDAVRLGAA